MFIHVQFYFFEKKTAPINSNKEDKRKKYLVNSCIKINISIYRTSFIYNNYTILFYNFENLLDNLVSV